MAAELIFHPCAPPRAWALSCPTGPDPVWRSRACAVSCRLADVRSSAYVSELLCDVQPIGGEASPCVETLHGVRARCVTSPASHKRALGCAPAACVGVPVVWTKRCDLSGRRSLPAGGRRQPQLLLPTGRACEGRPSLTGGGGGHVTVVGTCRRAVLHAPIGAVLDDGGGMPIGLWRPWVCAGGVVNGASAPAPVCWVRRPYKRVT